jgi:hypothetical protein
MRRCPLLLLFALAACEHYERPNRPLPEDFSAVTLAGQTLDRDALRGRPWVVNVWLPG